MGRFFRLFREYGPPVKALMFAGTRYSLGAMLWPFLPEDRKTLLAAGFMLLMLTGIGGRLHVWTTMAQGWEPAIGDFEKQDKAHPPKPGVIVFAGSSSFRFW